MWAEDDDVVSMSFVCRRWNMEENGFMCILLLHWAIQADWLNFITLQCDTFGVQMTSQMGQDKDKVQYYSAFDAVVSLIKAKTWDSELYYKC